MLPVHRNESAATRQRKGGSRQAQGKKSLGKLEEATNSEKQKQREPTRLQSWMDHFRRLSRRETAIRILQWIRTYPLRAVGIVWLVLVILRPSRAYRWYFRAFGWHYLQGGSIGTRLERWSMRRAYQAKLDRQAHELIDLGIDF